MEADESQRSVHRCAQRGDLPGLKALVEGDSSQANERDAENVTPLHWAAINGHIECCEYLLQHGAQVDAVGGELAATPLQWSARNGQLNLMHLLIKHGADPTFLDKQGFNALHLTTHSSYVMSLIFMLQQNAFSAPEAIDTEDREGHTPLMWAAFQGDALSVDVLLKHGASVHTVDESGLTPLHWAVARGNRLCIERIVAAGADLHAKDHEGKTAEDMAQELHTLGAYTAALYALNRDQKGRPIRRLYGPKTEHFLMYAIPFVWFGLLFYVLSWLPWYLTVPTLVGGIALMHVGIGVFVLDPRKPNAIKKSPYFLALLAMSLAWGFIMWLKYVAPATSQFWAQNTVIGVIFLIIVGTLCYSVSISPGRCPRPSSPAERQADIEQLASRRMLSGLTFCMTCLARRPLRSKHCHICGICVPRHDHHCPWINNCVGLRNHRPFIILLAAVQVEVPLYLILVYQCMLHAHTDFLDQVPESLVARYRDRIFSAWITAAVEHNGMVFFSSLWIVLMDAWLCVLFVMQLAQIARQLTTFEASNVGRYGFMGGRGDMNMSSQNGFIEQQTERLVALGMRREDAQARLHGCAHRRKRTLLGLCMGIGSSLLSIVGLDLYTRGKGGQGLSRSRAAANPFDKGIYGNCLGTLIH